MYSYLPIVISSLTLIPNTFASYYSIFIRSDNHVPSCREIYAILMVSYPAFPLHCIGIHNPESGPSHLIAYLGHIHFSFTELRHIPVITIELFPLTYVGNTWIAIGPCSLWGFIPCLLCPSVLPNVGHSHR